MKKPIQILGIEITEEKFPNLYFVAENNPLGLAEQLKSWAKTGSTDILSAAIILEHDLEHEERVNSKKHV